MTGYLKSFRGNRRGNFAILTAVLIVPLAISAGVMLDLGTISRTKAELQHAMDAAALAVAREGPGITDARANEIANSFVDGNFDPNFTKLSIKRVGTSVEVSALTNAHMSFGGLLGYDDWNVDAVAVADITLNNYEIALVLDTTGSMAGGKLTAMKDAVVGLIDTMSQDITEKEQLKMALVPFATFVNVGPHHGPKFNKKGKMVKGTGAEWLDLKGEVAIPQLELKTGVSRFEAFNNLGQPWSGCVETREPTKKVAYDTTDAEPKRKRLESLFVPAFSIDEPDLGYQNSYIASTVDPLDKSLIAEVRKLAKYGVGNALGLLTGGGGGDDDDDDDDGGGGGFGGETEWNPVGAAVTERKGPNAGCDMQPISPLSTDYNDLKSKVNGLVASGTTNIMEGVAWGWRVLSPGAPFSEGQKYGGDTRKIVILLTDGSNVFGVNNTKLGSSYSSMGFAVDARLKSLASGGTMSKDDLMNVKTLEACTNAKAEGLELYTIRLEEPDKTTGMMLKDCASSAEHFFDAPSRSQLDEVFSKIRKKITSVRITS